MKSYHMDDVGTRMEHLADLHELWSRAYAYLTMPNVWHSKKEEEQALDLEKARDLLSTHMATISFDPAVYGKIINGLPKPEDIKGNS
jgi:hypothetical protein